MKRNRCHQPKLKEMQVHILWPGNIISANSYVVIDCRKIIPKDMDEVSLSLILGTSLTFSGACGIAGTYANHNGYDRLNMTFDAS